MADPYIVDTNVLVVANDNGHAHHADPACIAACARFLNAITSGGHVVIDDAFAIVREYMRRVDGRGQPGVGDAFLKWVLSNRSNSERCTCVPITDNTDRVYEEFPDDPELATFDRSDRKFVAVSLAHPDHPAIANAVDSDWMLFRKALIRHGVHVQQLCNTAMRKPRRSRY